MAEAVVSSAAKWIANLLIQEAKLLFGVRDQVEDLLRELRQMQCFLKDADSKQDERLSIRNLVDEIREVAYEAENLISAFLFQVDEPTKRKGLRNFLTRYGCIFNEAKDRHNIGSDINTIKGKITCLTANLQSYGIIAIAQERHGSSSAVQSRPDVRRTYSHVVDEDFVGSKPDIKILLSHLVGEEATNHRAVSICGMGGLGKTTLARKVYHHKDVRCHFDAFAWVSISQQWQLKDVLQRILTTLLPDRSGTSIVNMIEDQLVKKLYQLQQEKKCLVVLDDIWSLDAWKSLSPAFPKGNKGSKIILTTRNKNVAAFVDQGGFLHEPKCLSKEDSWKLFEKKAFPITDFTDFEVDERLKNLGMEMVEECKGLPLAIVVLGGLLTTKQTLGEWQTVHQSIDSYLKRGKFIGGQDGTVLDVLALSYQDLPYQLKACFLFLGNYPEDFQIEVERLYQMWMAEGIVSEEERRDKETLMDVAERFLGELAQRCMVQVELELEEDYSPIRGRRRFKYCRIHDLMRDLSLSKGKEENFLEVIDLQHKTEEAHPFHSSMETAISGSKIHRLAFYYIGRSSDCRLIKQRAQHIRAVSFFNQDDFNDSTVEELTSLTKNSKFLRVINFEFKFEDRQWATELPKEIGNLIVLRYLSLRGTRFTILPASIGNLRYLQTLDLLTVNDISVPNVLWKMEGLIHLYLPEYNKFSTEGGVLLRLDGLSKIETIEGLASDKVDVRDLFKLTNLQRLTVRIQEKLEDLATVYNYLLNSKHRLQYTSIEIDSCDFCAEEEEGLSLLRNLVSSDFLVSLQINGILRKLPSHFGPSLTSLFLFNSKLYEDPMATLEKLPNLRSLWLKKAFVGKEMVCSAHGFPHLRRLYLRNMTTLEEWKVVDGAMPNLSFLQICCCYHLKMVPDGLRFIATLQELDIWGMDDAFEDRLRVVDGEEGEDFHKIQHIPYIHFRKEYFAGVH